MSSFKWIVASAIAIAPVAMLGASACSDDTPASSSATPYVDPGGTFGAEITINVVGRGRVTTPVGGIDCPSDCFAKLVFSSASADGAAGSIGLKAIPTPGASFEGWTFETEAIGSRGRGPDNCNPVKRAATQPAVDLKAESISLPFGEATGASPAGQEGACGAFTKVPLAYKIVANFTKDSPIIDDGGLDGGDGGEGQVVFNAPVPGAVGREMGIASSYLYWRWQSGGFDGISYSSFPGTSSIPGSSTIVQQPTISISTIEFDVNGVVYQSSDDALRVIRSGLTSATTITAGPPPSCSALAIDSSYNVYCRSQTGSLLQWMFSSSYTTMNTLYTGLPFGNDLSVESSSGPAYFSSSSVINSLPLSPTPDGGFGTPTQIASASQATNLESYSGSTHLWWIEFTDTLKASSTKTTGASSVSTTSPAFPTGLAHLAPDTSSGGSYYWAANSSSIYHAYYLGGSSTTVFKTGISGLGGMTADSQYVYWTQSDGTVHRESRLGK